jgi:hypothetical protein
MADDPYSEIRALKARLAAIEKAAGINPEPVTFTTAQIADRYFYTAHRDAIMKAASEGRIVEAEPIERPAPVYPPSIIPGWKVTGQDTYEAPAPAPKTEGGR